MSWTGLFELNNIKPESGKLWWKKQEFGLNGLILFCRVTKVWGRCTTPLRQIVMVEVRAFFACKTFSVCPVFFSNFRMIFQRLILSLYMNLQDLRSWHFSNGQECNMSPEMSTFGIFWNVLSLQQNGTCPRVWGPILQTVLPYMWIELFNCLSWSAWDFFAN